METKTVTKEYNLDAKGKKLGRLASEVATILMGKKSLDFAKHQVANVKVIVSNASKLDISKKKMEEKSREVYSGFHSGLKIYSPKDIASKHGMKEVLRLAVRGMIPPNKLRDRVLKNLEITD
jgi:large subunit ribosomal protein L13